MLKAHTCPLGRSASLAQPLARVPRPTARRGRSLLGCKAVLTPQVATLAEQLLSFGQPILEKLTPKVCFQSSLGILVLTYPLMMFRPRWKLTQLWVKSSVIPVVFSLLYCVSLFKLFQGPFPTTVASVVHPTTCLPSIPVFANFFKSEVFAATAWLHLVLLDFLQARYVWADGLNFLVPTTHSLLLCFMMGPLGLLSHMLTKAAIATSRKQSRA